MNRIQILTDMCAFACFNPSQKLGNFNLKCKEKLECNELR